MAIGAHVQSEEAALRGTGWQGWEQARLLANMHRRCM